MIIETYGTEERTRYAAKRARGLGLSHLVILPIPSTKDGRLVCGTDIPLAETLSCVETGSVVVEYGAPASYKALAEAAGARVLDLSQDEQFLLENAELTAVGTLSHILKNATQVPSEMRIGIIGYGRIGAALLRIFLFLGAKSRVYTSKLSTAISLAEDGIDSYCTDGVESYSDSFSDLDILINTAPRDMRQLFSGGAVPSGLKVIELASGNNFVGISGVEKLPSLPEKAFPESAGETVFRALERFL